MVPSYYFLAQNHIPYFLIMWSVADGKGVAAVCQEPLHLKLLFSAVDVHVKIPTNFNK